MKINNNTSLPPVYKRNGMLSLMLKKILVNYFLILKEQFFVTF